MRVFLALLAGILGFYAYIPYTKDILKSKVQPARSTRVMFVLLLTLSLLQQKDLGGRLSLAVTIGELIGSVMILLLSIQKGMGGFRRLDLICYLLLIIDLFFWQTTKNSLVALHLTVFADIIAFTPTMEKTWRNAKSETAPFFIIGAIAPIFSILSSQKFTYGIVLYPATLVIFNSLEVFLIYRKKVA